MIFNISNAFLRPLLLRSSAPAVLVDIAILSVRAGQRAVPTYAPALAGGGVPPDVGRLSSNHFGTRWRLAKSWPLAGANTPTTTTYWKIRNIMFCFFHPRFRFLGIFWGHTRPPKTTRRRGAGRRGAVVAVAPAPRAMFVPGLLRRWPPWRGGRRDAACVVA